MFVNSHVYHTSVEEWSYFLYTGWSGDALGDVNKLHAKLKIWSTWVTQVMKHLTLDLCSDLDLRVMSSSPALGCTLGVDST